MSGLEHLRIAGEHDTAGREREAVVEYEAAFRAGLPDEVLPGALLGYGSTLRNVGRVDESIDVLADAAVRFPELRALRAFLALSLHAAGRSSEALAETIELLLDERDASFQRYRRSLSGYAAALRGDG